MKRSVKILWQLFFGGLLLVILVFLAADLGLFGKMPSLQELENPEADLASEVYTSDVKLMGKYYSENRSEVKYNQISPNIIHALVATEDQNFYDHSGIDARAVARAVIKLGTDGGGSPITQQLAKMMLGQGHGNVFTRGLQKIKEWIIAVSLKEILPRKKLLRYTSTGRHGVITMEYEMPQEPIFKKSLQSCILKRQLCWLAC